MADYAGIICIIEFQNTVVLAWTSLIQISACQCIILVINVHNLKANIDISGRSDYADRC